jgi:hypothetical protein
LTARITLSCNTLPDRVFFCFGHEYPMRNLGDGAAATAANIVKGR